MRAIINAQQRRIEMLESQVKNKSRDDSYSHRVVEPCHQNLAKRTLTHGAQISARSKQLIMIEEQLGVLDKHEKDSPCI